MSLEEVGSTAIIGERCDRADHRQVAPHGAEIGLQPPDRHQHRTRHAEALFDALEGARMPLQHVGATFEAASGHHAAGELLEALLEHALATIFLDHALIEGDA